MEIKLSKHVDGDQIVTTIEIRQTVSEFLADNGQVWAYAQQMRPGSFVEKQSSLRITQDD